MSILGIAERREREKEALRTRIVEAARDIVSDQGLDALSMRAIAERIEYSPATLYLYFRDKDEILREVVAEGFRQLDEAMRDQLEAVGEGASATERHRALGRGYARFALAHTAYFRVMFELPSTARADCDASPAAEEADDAGTWGTLVRAVCAAQEESGAFRHRSELAEEAALISWGLIHGLVSLFLAGRMRDAVATPEALFALLERAMDSLSPPGAGGAETGAAGVA